MSPLLWGAVLAGSSLAVGCSPAPASATGTVAAADTTLAERRWSEGLTFEAFLAEADARVATWQGNHARAMVVPELVRRAEAVGPWRLLVVAEDWCGDSANTIPYLARLVEATSTLEMRVIDSDQGRSFMEAHRTPDGRPATPTVLALDADGEIAACWIERPAALQRWWLENEEALEREELLRQKYAWYDEDLGGSTLQDIVRMLEAAHSGEAACPVEGP